MNKRIFKIVSIISALILCVVFCGAFVFIAENSDHCCSEESCAICDAIAQYGNTVRSLFAVILFFAFAFFTALSTLHIFLGTENAKLNRNTLISLKVELLN